MGNDHGKVMVVTLGSGRTGEEAPWSWELMPEATEDPLSARYFL